MNPISFQGNPQIAFSAAMANAGATSAYTPVVQFGTAEDTSDTAQKKKAPSAEDVKAGAKSFFHDIIEEIRAFVADLFEGVFGKFRHAINGAGNAVKVITSGLSLGDTLSKAEPESAFTARARAIGTLSFAEFYDTLIELEETPSAESKELRFQLYSAVIQEFPGILKNPEFPKLRKVSLLKRFLDANPRHQDKANELQDLIISEETQAKLAKLNPKQLKAVAKALAGGKVATVQSKIDVNTTETPAEA